MKSVPCCVGVKLLLGSAVNYGRQIEQRYFAVTLHFTFSQKKSNLFGKIEWKNSLIALNSIKSIAAIEWKRATSASLKLCKWAEVCTSDMNESYAIRNMNSYGKWLRIFPNFHTTVDWWFSLRKPTNNNDRQSKQLRFSGCQLIWPKEMSVLLSFSFG